MSRSRKRVQRVVVGFATVILASLGVVGATSGAAFAGSNGQQLTFCLYTRFSDDAAVDHISFIGTNEKGWNNISTPPIAFYDGESASKQRCGWLYGWWWVGDVQVNVYDKDNNYLREYHCFVQKTQDDDWAGCK